MPTVAMSGTTKIDCTGVPTSESGTASAEKRRVSSVEEVLKTRCPVSVPTNAEGTSRLSIKKLEFASGQ